MKSLFRHLLFSACCLASIASHAVTADNGLVSVSSESPSVRGILAVGDDFAVFQDRSSVREPASISIAGIGDMTVETPKVVPFSGKKPIRYRAKDTRTYEDPASGIVYPIYIDILEDTVYVPYGEVSTLHLTEDSTFEPATVFWSSEPSGISGTGDYVLIPGDLAQGHYTVTAAFSEKPEWNDTCNVEVIRVEISPKELSGCEKCFTDGHFHLVNSYCPNGVTWSLKPKEGTDETAGTISEDGCFAPGSTGGEFIVRATSKDLESCFSEGTVLFYSVSPAEPIIKDYRVARHFCFVQLFLGNASFNGRVARVTLFGTERDCSFDDRFYIDSKDTDPAAGSALYNSQGCIWSDSPMAILSSTLDEGDVIDLHFRTGIYCREQVPLSLSFGDALTAIPFQTFEWDDIVIPHLNADGELIIVHECSDSRHTNILNND